MSHCNMVADNICSQAGVKNNADFSKYLTVATEMFFTLTNDDDADIRLLADECLTKVVKNLSETGNNIGRMQVELYKEIKKNGSSRSLRSALSKFAAICGLIRPQKTRAYIENLTPCFIRIASTRKEEAVHETMAENVKRIFSHLGHFANDTEIDQLLNTFLVNLSDNSASIRRSTAKILTSIIKHCPKPAKFTLWLYKTIMETVIPCKDPHTLQTEKLIGLLVGIKPVIPLIQKYEDQLEMDTSDIMHKSIQLYELCLCLIESKNSSIISQALETLQQLLKTPPNVMKQILISPAGITQSTIFSKDEKSTSVQNIQAQNETVKSEQEIHETNEPELHQGLERGRMKLMDSIDEDNPNYDPEDPTHDPSEGESSDKTQSKRERKKSSELFEKGHIGDFCDQDVPLIYCCRKLVSLFLLTPSKGDLIPDRNVRVSTKAIAIGCLTNAIAMSPKVFLLTLYAEDEDEDTTDILIRDVANYTEHEDPQLRGSAVLLLGQVLKGALVESTGNLLIERAKSS